MSIYRIQVSVNKKNKDDVINLIHKFEVSGLIENENRGELFNIEIYCKENSLAEIKREKILNNYLMKPLEVSIYHEKKEDYSQFRAQSEPVSIGEFYFCPPWNNLVIKDKKRIEINPGLGFGTGHHESTRILVLMLMDYLYSNTVSNILDIGTGSGIVSLVANEMGQENIYAIDNDKDALQIYVLS